MKLTFPDGFYWGASTSSHQVEGGNKNNWTKWEEENAERLVFDAKNCWEKWQQEKFPEMFDIQNYISGKATEHYSRFEEDFDIAKSLGHNANRFSIEWSRVEPEEGKFDEKEIEHYRNVLRSLKKRNITPFVTLWHWSEPLWFTKNGSWKNKKSPFSFERYTKKIAESLGEEIKFYITLNEPEVFASHSYLRGVWPPQERNYFSYRRVIRNLIKAHKKSYTVLKNKNKDAKVCIAKHNVYFEAHKNKPINNILKYIADMWWNDWFLKKIHNFQDIIAVNNYHKNSINYGFKKNLNENLSDIGWELSPESLSSVVKELSKYKLPIYVTEHGIADSDDSKRAWFIKESLNHLHKVISAGADVRGYFYWSLLDNFEWDKGFWPRFGLVKIDYKTQKRTIRQSAQVYKEICESNMLEL